MDESGLAETYKFTSASLGDKNSISYLLKSNFILICQFLSTGKKRIFMVRNLKCDLLLSISRIWKRPTFSRGNKLHKIIYIYIYIYIYMCVCVCVRVCVRILQSSQSKVGNNSVRTIKLYKIRIYKIFLVKSTK